MPRASALALAFALGHAVGLHRVWLFRVTSEVIRNPIGVRIHVRLDDCSQLVVVTCELLGTHKQVVSEFLMVLRAIPR